MSTKHSPGPWIEGNYGGSIVGPMVAGAELTPEQVSEIRYYGGPIIAESIAPRDRPLICAAPEMFEALKLWHEFHEHWNFCDVEREGGTCDECESLEGFANDATDAALAKARGGSQ